MEVAESTSIKELISRIDIETEKNIDLTSKLLYDYLADNMGIHLDDYTRDHYRPLCSCYTLPAAPRKPRSMPVIVDNYISLIGKCKTKGCSKKANNHIMNLCHLVYLF